MPSMHHATIGEPYKNQIGGGGENGLQFVNTRGEWCKWREHEGVALRNPKFLSVRFSLFILNHL